MPIERTTMPDALKLPVIFDAARLQAELQGFAAPEFVPHFNIHYYQGDWSALALRSVAGESGQIFPDPEQREAFADTALMARCAYVQEVLRAFSCPLLAVRFLRLKAGSVIKEHRDFELGFADGEIRLHVPVVTNPEVEFMLNGRQLVMREGECWYVDVSCPHAVANRGATDRVHLVIDCVVNDWLRDWMWTAAHSAEDA